MSFKVFYSIILLNEIVPLEPETKKFLKDKIQTAFYKKGSYLTRTGELCNRVFVLKKGLVRGYFVNNNKEITTWISRENEMVTSISGYFKNKQGLENIQALEDTYTNSLHSKICTTAFFTSLKWPQLTEYCLSNIIFLLKRELLWHVYLTQKIALIFL